jgi:hypothetical protein
MELEKRNYAFDEWRRFVLGALVVFDDNKGNPLRENINQGGVQVRYCEPCSTSSNSLVM